jgi:hypothetical protein
MGHRQKYTQIRVTAIDLKSKKSTKKKTEAKEESKED